ncbi:PMCA [Bugula neritina]|uniref:PMCA n=1 Tax=Bugula neritina TaxID=10212 RepID=A0A7J7JUS7_BUGNE|nr:PMCA [Bugula neritina]
MFIGIWICTMAGQVLLVQLGGFVFSCKPLTLEQWMWCVFFGVSCLIWTQIITFIPVHSLPKAFAVGRNVEEKDIANNAALSQLDGPTEARSKGQILWIRSISRLQQQIDVVKAIRDQADASSDPATKCRSRSRSLASISSAGVVPQLLRRLSGQISTDMIDVPFADSDGQDVILGEIMEEQEEADRKSS